ncbi:hypothetical protein K469DRAFT_720974 [Zopfia rhizophila CBS 207.26]|uniref:F-box domain-containing protein n=1 Tax=Zopfia rhizophila CBS 207.26 TaxID=1314779 RepID=A0A6A6DC66_9PEZI|nr:hypothetical protein K469DRAFT_720974 [Zopfia rhizophila CBS 207.26]
MSFRHRDILELFMGTLSGDRDEFGRGIVPPTPLAFDRISEGQPLSSDFLLSRLPIELIWQIIQLVPKADLANLALVNRNCRQLARSRQFSSVTLDYSYSATGILGILVKEHLERSLNHGKTISPSLGACVRSINVATQPGWIKFRHGVDLSEEFDQMDEEMRKRRLDEACNCFYDLYMPNIILVLSSPSVLPHLERLDWEDRSTVDRNSFEAITSSNIQHLTLRRINVDEDFNLNLTPDECNWRLRSLYLDVMWKLPSRKKEGRLSPLLCKILCLAAPTLESLTWACFPWPKGQPVLLTDSVDGRPSFPKLNDLKISFMTQYDPSWLDVLIQHREGSPIRHLDINISAGPEVTEFFKKCGCLPRLETFVWQGLIQNDTDIAFLRANMQIRKLRLNHPAPSAWLEEQLFPLLCKSFSNLTSLSLTWDGEEIPQSALDRISTLDGLEQICLSAGNQHGWRHSWIINHGALQNCFRNLRGLRKIALSRDTYVDQEESDPLDYYERRVPRNTVELSAEETLAQLWELQHRDDMILIADEYAKLLPNLGWIYFGQLPMCIAQGQGGVRLVVPLSEDRDSCWTLLRRIFGRENDLSL